MAASALVSTHARVSGRHRIISPLLANIYLSILDRRFAEIWDTEMSPRWRRQHRRRRGLPTYRLIRYADDFIVLIKGTRSDAEQIKSTSGSCWHVT